MTVIVNVILALAGFSAAGRSGSSVALAAAVMAMATASSAGLAWAGLDRTETTPDAQVPVGPRLEPLFWTHVAAIVLFGLGAGIATAAGVARLGSPGGLIGLDGLHRLLALPVAASAMLVLALPATASAKTRREALAMLAGTVLSLAGLHLAAHPAAGVTEAQADGAAAIAIGLTMALAAALTAIELKRILAVADRRHTAARSVAGPAALSAARSVTPAAERTAGQPAADGEPDAPPVTPAGPAAAAATDATRPVAAPPAPIEPLPPAPPGPARPRGSGGRHLKR